MTTPTSSLVATATDMARFAMLHLADGRCNGREILSESLSRSMRTQQATIHPAVPGWGYAFQLDVDNGRQLAEHGGDIGGFSSLFAVIPEERSAFFIVNHGEGTTAFASSARCSMPSIRDPQPMSFRGRSCADAEPPRVRISHRSSPVPHLRGWIGADFEVAVGADGVLALGQEWVPLERDLFVRTDGERLLGFARDNLGQVAVVSGGSWRVADRLPATPR